MMFWKMYLVAQPLRRNDGDLIADALVGLKIERELWVVALDDDLGRLLDGLGANATHLGGFDGGNNRGWFVEFNISCIQGGAPPQPYGVCSTVPKMPSSDLAKLPA